MTQAQRLAVAIFGGLLLLCVSLMIIAAFMGPVAKEAILPIATDGFKTVLGALVGAISTLIGQKDGSR